MDYKVTFELTHEYEVEAANEEEAITTALEEAAFDLPRKPDAIVVEALGVTTATPSIAIELDILMSTRFNQDGNFYSRYSQDEDEECVEDAVARLFEQNGFTKEQFQIDHTVALYSPSGDYGAIAISWVKDGKVRLEMYKTY